MRYCWFILMFLAYQANSVWANTERGVYKFDFGTSKSPVFDGFKGVDKDVLYTRAKGYGWTYDSTGKLRSHFNRSNYDDLCCDLVLAKASTFKLDLPNGWYVVHIWLGDLNNLFDYLRFGIKAEGIVLVKSRNPDFETYRNFFFRNSNLDYKKSHNPWDIYIAPRFIRRAFLVRVIDGCLDLEFQNCRLNALVVCRKDLSEFIGKEIISIESRRRQQFDANWSEMKQVDNSEALRPDAEDIQRGYVVFGRHWMEKIYPETTPTAEERIRKLTVTCSLSEYEPVTFGIYPLSDLKDVRITVGDLIEKGGVKFDSSNVDICVQRYRIARSLHSMTYSVEPAQITNFDKVDIERGVTRKFWLDTHVPVDTKPGVYEGRVLVSSSNRPATTLILKLEVLPFKLLRDNQRHNYAFQFAIPWHYRRFREDSSYWQHLEKDYVFMKEFGITLPTFGYGLSSWPIIKWDSSKKKFDSVDLSEIEKTMAVYEKVGGFPSPYIVFCTYQMTTRGYYTVPIKRNSKDWASLNQSPEYWLAYREIIKAIKKKQVSAGWPEFIFFTSAELSNGGLEFIQYGKKVLDNLHDIGGIKTANMSNSLREIRMIASSVNVSGMQIKRCTEQAVDYGKKNSLDNSFWVYQSNNRFTYGFYFHKIGAKGSFKENFQSVRVDPYNGFDGKSDEALSSVGYSLPSPNGPVPLIQCYEYREGIDDARYLYTLEEYIKKAKNHGDLQAKAAAEKSEEVLSKILSRINMDLTYYQNEVGFWDNPAYDKLRSQISSQIVALSNLN